MKATTTKSIDRNQIAVDHCHLTETGPQIEPRRAQGPQIDTGVRRIISSPRSRRIGRQEQTNWTQLQEQTNYKTQLQEQTNYRTQLQEQTN